MLICPSGHQNQNNNKFCMQCGAKLEAFLKAGSLFRGRYRVEAVLSSSGGFGITYLVRDQDMFGQLRVVKQLRAARQDGKALELFEREARILSQLSHPQIPKLHAFFSDADGYYLVQDCIEGQTLRQIINDQKTCAVGFVTEVLKQSLEILAYIHAVPLMHRDIKPENLIWGKDEKIYLIDFGAVKDVVQSADPAEKSTVIYTQGYAPPEQLMGKVFPTSDTYALGVCLLEMLTGRPPLELYQVAERRFAWREHALPGLPANLAEVLDGMTAEHVSQRSSIDSIREALFPATTALQSQTTQIAPVVFTQFKQPGIHVGTLLAKKECLQLAGHAAPIKNLAWGSRSNRLISGSGPGEGMLKLWEIPAGREILSLRQNPLGITALSWHPDENMLASAASDSRVQIWDLATQAVSYSIDTAAPVRLLRWSPDGECLAGVQGGHVMIWQGRTGQVLANLYTGTQSRVTAMEWRPDSQFLALATDGGSLSIWEVMTEQKTVEWQAHLALLPALQWSSDGQALASVGQDQSLRLWEAYTEKQKHSLPLKFIPVSLSWHGSLLAVGGHEGSILLWDSLKARPLDTLNYPGELHVVAWSPDGTYLAAAGSDRQIYLWKDF